MTAWICINYGAFHTDIGDTDRKNETDDRQRNADCIEMFDEHIRYMFIGL